MSNRLTLADITDQTDALRGALIDAGVLSRDATLTAINQGAGWWLRSNETLPAWVDTPLGLTKNDAWDTLRRNEQAAWAYTDGANAVAELACAGAWQTWKRLVADGMAPVPAVATANALA